MVTDASIRFYNQAKTIGFIAPWFYRRKPFRRTWQTMSKNVPRLYNMPKIFPRSPFIPKLKRLGFLAPRNCNRFWLGKPKTKTSCHCCGFETECVPVDPPPGSSREEPFFLCEVCYSTHLASPTLYPNVYSSQTQMLCAGVAWGINRVLDEIRQANDQAKQPKPQEQPPR